MLFSALRPDSADLQTSNYLFCTFCSSCSLTPGRAVSTPFYSTMILIVPVTSIKRQLPKGRSGAGNYCFHDKTERTGMEPCRLFFFNGAEAARHRFKKKGNRDEVCASNLRVSSEKTGCGETLTL